MSSAVTTLVLIESQEAARLVSLREILYKNNIEIVTLGAWVTIARTSDVAAFYKILEDILGYPSCAESVVPISVEASDVHISQSLSSTLVAKKLIMARATVRMLEDFLSECRMREAKSRIEYFIEELVALDIVKNSASLQEKIVECVRGTIANDVKGESQDD